MDVWIMVCFASVLWRKKLRSLWKERPSVHGLHPTIQVTCPIQVYINDRYFALPPNKPCLQDPNQLVQPLDA